MTATDTAAALVDTARALAPAIRALSGEIEEGRRLPPKLVQRMAEAGLFRMFIPRALGGAEVHPSTFVRVVEEVARADGSAGWSVMIGAGTAIFSGLLPDAVARAVYGADPLVITGGTFRPSGKAVVVDGGYRVEGRWQFGSGCEHCDWLFGGCIVYDGETPRVRASGAPEAHLLLFPAADCRIIDTWSVGGLRGTGSHDFAVSDVFVPAERAVSLPFDQGVRDEPLYRLPAFSLLAVCVAAVPLGIARGAIDALTELAGAKTPTGSRGLLRDRAMTQVQVAQAEGLLRSARALVFEVIDEVWDAVVAGRAAALEQRALLRLAAAQAATQSAQAVDLMYSAGGATSIYTSSPLERAFRDVHTATQHILAAPSNFELAGRVLLGLDPGTAFV